MNIIIITSGTLPVPHTKGGGVELLVQHLIDNNEKTAQLNITLFSVFNAESEKIARNYKYTKIILIKKIDLLEKLWRYYRAIVRRLIKINLHQSSPWYISQVIKYLKKHRKNEKMIIENNTFFIEPISKLFKGDLYYHMHNDDINISNKTTLLKKQTENLKKYKKVICVSNFIKKRVQYATKLKNVIMLQNCIDLEKFGNKNTYSGDEMRKYYNIKENEVVIMFSGRLIAEKGVKELLIAFKKIHTNKSIRLLVVGGVSYSQNNETDYIVELKNICKDMNDKVIFTGYIDYEKMPQIYNMIDISVVPTLYFEEAAGLVAIEAMAARKPLIITDSGGLPEYANKECAICIKRSDNFIKDLTLSLQELINNEELRKKMGEAGFEYSQQFNIQNYYENYIRILTES